MSRDLVIRIPTERVADLLALVEVLWERFEVVCRPDLSRRGPTGRVQRDPPRQRSGSLLVEVRIDDAVDRLNQARTLIENLDPGDQTRVVGWLSDEFGAVPE